MGEGGQHNDLILFRRGDGLTRFRASPHPCRSDGGCPAAGMIAASSWHAKKRARKVQAAAHELRYKPDSRLMLDKLACAERRLRKAMEQNRDP
jgi:hypothetical protein